VDFQTIGSTRVVVAPDRLRQIGMRHHVAGILHQMTENVIFCYRQADSFRRCAIAQFPAQAANVRRSGCFLPPVYAGESST